MENKDIEYDNLEYNMNKVIISVNKYYQNKFPQNILDFFEEIYPSKDTKYNIDYFGICTIIPVKIFIMIKDILPKVKEIEIPKIKILENNNFLLIYHNKNIFEIGNIKDQLLFIPKYILKFNSNEILKHEINKLNTYSFKDYLIKRGYLENKGEFQQLNNSINKPIGDLIILDNKNFIRSNSKDIPKKNIYNKKGLINYRGKTVQNINIEKNKAKDLINNKNNKKSNDKNSLYIKSFRNNDENFLFQELTYLQKMFSRL